MSHFEKNLGEETIYEGKVFTVKKRTVQLENGHIGMRELVLHNGGACVLPIDDDGNAYFVRQFRAPFEREILELPAGKLEKGENPDHAVVRELREETGFTAESIVSMGSMLPSVGYCGEVIYLYLATGLKSGDKQPDDDEFLSTVKIPFKDAVNMCMSGEITDAKTVILLLKANEYLK